MNTALYLSQSYQDAWDDYLRSLTKPAFPTWDYIVLTASNAHQAEGFQRQLEARRDFLPKRTRFLVIPDENGVRVGSGGATLSVLKRLRQLEDSFAGKRFLVIHSGGDSKRVPQYSALGKLFSPVPHALPDGRSSTLFDEFLIAMSAVPGRIREGMLLVSGDVLLLFNPLLIDYSGSGAACISFKEDAQTGKDHGVYLKGADGNVRRFLHKQSVETLTSLGAVNESGAVDIDTGAVIFGVDVMNALYGLIATDGSFDGEKYAALVNSEVRLSLYGDFQYPLAADSTLEAFYDEKPEGEFCDALREARTRVWQALRPFRLKLLRLAPAKFIHFGTTAEILRLMDREIGDYRELGWARRVNCSVDERASGYNSVLSPGAQIGEDCYLEVAYVHSGAKVGRGSVLSYIDVHAGEVVPDGVVLHGLKQADGRFVCRIYGVDDNPKADRLFGAPLSGDLWEAGEARTLWNARLYPECDTIQQAVGYALKLYALVKAGRTGEILAWPRRKSLWAGFNDADPQAILDWNQRMAELVKMNGIEAAILSGAPVSGVAGTLPAPLTKLQRAWMDDHLAKADYGMGMRLHFYVGSALGDDGEMTAAFGALSEAMLADTVAGLRENRQARITADSHTVSLPLRVNWGGGWSDTPPYCTEKGGTVLNAAILLNGQRPVTVSLARLAERKIVFESRDMDVRGEFDAIEPLQSVGDPFDPFVLQKAALLACGVIPARGGDLNEILERLGGGFRMNTEVTGVPKGSGLGTSSILAAACVKALFEFVGIAHTEDDLYGHVLSMEQIMSTGGGWQDQVGGVTDGIKYIMSRPGLRQDLYVQHLRLDPRTLAELNERFVLIYT
ncbi:MAG: bifunctional fucokinase/L-fucose-1-P-guanylyltransferase, partial [Clostridia bacterium]|nr:bifunctional fucokinase/L-fucose-1-P-guanylyltransferase [Clostridia bacterium]